MMEGQGYRRAMSLHLARTLDEIGLNKVTVKKRRDVHLCLEQMVNVYHRLTQTNITSRKYHFGSQTEGATTPGMESDIDSLHCINSLNVIDDLADWQQGKVSLLMLHEDTAPGYCRLQVLRPDVWMGMKMSEHETYGSSGRVILKNTFIHSVLGTMISGRSGPAASESGRPGFVDEDFVAALPCDKWPRQAADFVKRRRRHDWPSQRLIEEAVSHRVFLVPVGYKLGNTEALEWRISASLAERSLMFSLTDVHIKCYAVLKILVKTFITPRIEDSISGYHCKTALLHCTETTEPSFWREDNLLQCITRCLEILRNWISDLFCPQFMICGENLFAGKVTVHNRDLLLSILTELIGSDGRALLHVKMDGLGHTLKARLDTEPSCIPVVDSTASVGLVGQLELYSQCFISHLMKSFIVHVENIAHEKPVLCYVYQTICFLERMKERANKHEREVLQSFIPLLSSWLGSLQSSSSLSHNMMIPDQAIQLMSTMVEYDVASMLKLASVLYCSGEFGKAEAMLQLIEDQFDLNDLRIICTCSDKPSRASVKFSHKMHLLKKKKARAKLFSHCVIFSSQEVHCTPLSFRLEMYRSVGEDTQHKVPFLDERIPLAAADCLPYLNYLRFLIYKQLGKDDLQRCALQNLYRCVREDHEFGHLETAWNLLGQCLEEEQDPDAAMAYYRASLKIRPRNNAANWHVSILWYKMLKNHGLLPGIAENQAEK